MVASLASLSTARLAEGGVALIVNARAKAVREGRADARQLRALVELHGRSFEPHSLKELHDSVREIRQRDPGLLAICGGDGTYQKTITSLIEVYGDHPLPMLLPLAGGTFNVLTTNLGLRAPARKMLSRAMAQVRATRRGARLRTTTVPILRLDDLRTSKREWGFIFANGVVSRVIARYTEGPPSTARAARVFSEAVGGFMMQTPGGRELVKRYHGDVRVDGRPLPESRFLGLVAATIQPAVLGFTPFAVKKRPLHSFNYLVSMVDAGQVIGALPALLRGRLWNRHPGLKNATAREMLVTTDEGFILDGETHPSGIHRELRVSVGPLLKFLRPA